VRNSIKSSILSIFHSNSIEEKKLKEYEKILQIREDEYKKVLYLTGQKAKKRGIKIKSTIIRGVSPADSILEFLKNNEADLIVLGTHGHSGVKKWIYGSVAEKIIRRSICPVFTIKSFGRQLL